MHDSNTTRLGAFAESVALRLEYEVLSQAFQETPPGSTIRAISAHLPSVTHDAAALAFIMRLDKTYFLTEYVRPTLVNTRLHQRFNSDTTIQRVARDIIKLVFESLRERPEQFLQYKLNTITIDRKRNGIE
jgi:hypothetical protein